ncbi:BLUF domain-containing protein [Ramlibacter sp. AN1015]|uniref:BLUF domain-containing protein n=1 Tax=Ramlibacter sp. AN1015 TaxID=3133428 RepID=UPI0030BE8A65
MPPPVARVLYASRACLEKPVFGELERIRRSALRNNQALGVHTALLHQAGWFLQWKEGPAVGMHRLMERVARDARHRELQVVHASRGPRLLDGPWSMAVVPCDEPPHVLAQRIARAASAGARDQDRAVGPAEVWCRIAMPLRCGQGGEFQESDACQRVLLASAVGTTAFELVRWLAARHGAAVAHRRFAALARDVASELADLRVQGRALRIVSLARKGLAVPLARALLQANSHLVLLLCGEAARDAALLDSMAAACAGHAQPPMLVGVGPDVRAHGALLALAASRRLAYVPAIADPRDYAGVWAALQPVLAQ